MTQLSPGGPNYYGPMQVLMELADQNPEAFAQYMNTPRDMQTDYRDKHWYKRYPTLAGVPGRSW